MGNEAPQNDSATPSNVRALAIAEWRRLDSVRELTEESIDAFVSQAELLSIRPDELLVDRQSELTHAYFVVTGRLKVELFDLFENSVQETHFSRGSVAGLLALIAPERVHLNIRAVDHTTVFRIRLPELLALASAHSSFQLFLLRHCANVVRKVTMSDRLLRRPKVIGVVHQSSSTRFFTARIVQRLRSLGENVCLAGDAPDSTSGSDVPFRPLVSDGKLIDSAQRESILKEWSAARRLVLDVGRENSPSGLMELIGGYADVILWCVDPSSAGSVLPQLRELQQAHGWIRNKIRLVWLLDRESDVAPYVAELNQVVHGDFKISLETPRTNQGSQLYRGMERLIQFLRGVQIGIALGGGAARGMAHLGVLKALEENGVYVDRMAGTSAGAMTGMTYAAGMDPAYATNCFKNDLRPSWIYRKIPGGGYWYLLHKYRLNRFGGMLRKYLHDYRVEQLPIPITTITVDLVEGEPLIRTEGDATRNILESINLPPLSLPIFDSGAALVDGGLLNNVPANILESQGCNFVIASTVTSRIEKDFMGIRAKGKPIGRLFASLQVIMRQTLIQNFKMNSVGVQPADFVIAPNVSKFDMSAFSRADEFAHVGETTALAQVAELRRLLAKLDPQLFGD